MMERGLTSLNREAVHPERGTPRRRRGVPLFGVIGILLIGLVAVWGFVKLSAPAAEPAPSVEAPFSTIPTAAAPANSPSEAAAPHASPGAVATVAGSPAPLGPMQVSIPSLGIVASYSDEDMVQGSLVLPNDPARLARYADGAALDDVEGRVLLSGHVSFNGTPGALKPLVTIRPGAQIFITDARGNKTEWWAATLTEYRKADLPQSVFAKDGPRMLVLVTCGGPVTQRKNTAGQVTYQYRDNIVVTAVPARR